MYKADLFSRNWAVIFSIYFFLLLSVNVNAGTGIKTFIGLSAAQVEIGGSMDGDSFVTGGGSLEILPEQDTALGMKISYGQFHEKRLLWELSLVMSDHDGQWLGFDTKSEFFGLNLDAKIHFTDWIVRPALVIGVSLYNSVTVEDGSTDGFSVEDAKYNGVFDSLRFGGGLIIHPHENWLIDLNVVQRYGSYSNVDGIESGELEDGIEGDGLSTEFGIKYLF